MATSLGSNDHYDTAVPHGLGLNGQSAAPTISSTLKQPNATTSNSLDLGGKTPIFPRSPSLDLEKGEPQKGQEDDGGDNDEGMRQKEVGPDENSPKSVDEIVVDWEGPEDCANPKNWSDRRKWAAVSIISCFTFISPISSAMVAPATEQIAEQFSITSTTIIAMTTSIFVLAYAIGPLFFGPLSEIYGRSRVVQIGNMWYLAWNLGCGFAQNKNQLIGFRFLAGLGGSAPLSIGGGVIGDTFTPEHRGQAIAIYSLAPLLGPVLGPILGAWVAERSTWRWVFWSTTLADAVVQLLGFFFLQETFAPLLLSRKADRIRASLAPEDQSRIRVITIFEKGEKIDWQAFMGKALVRPFKIFAYEPIVQLFGLYMAFLYGLLYLAITSIPDIFEINYGESVGIAGLHYIALGIGLTGFSQVNARSMDKVYAYLKNKNGGVGRPEFRLPAMVPGTILTPIGLLIMGWCAQTRQPWIATDIGIMLIGGGSILCFQSLQTYVIDTFTLLAASALAAVTFLRSCAGFGFPLFAPAMYDALGYGWGNTVLAIVGAVLGCPAPFLFWHYGKEFGMPVDTRGSIETHISKHVKS